MLSANDEVRMQKLESRVRFLESNSPMLQTAKVEKLAWYENIPDGGVLCLVNGSETVNSIISYDPEFNHCFTSENDAFLVAKPLTKQEIQVFMDNAPEAK